MAKTTTTRPVTNGAPVDVLGAAVAQTETRTPQSSMEAEYLRLKAENERLQKQVKNASRVSLRVSEKGALSVYGMGRFPVTLYREQWEKLLAMKDEVLDFISDNDSKLKTKGE